MNVSVWRALSPTRSSPASSKALEAIRSVSLSTEKPWDQARNWQSTSQCADASCERPPLLRPKRGPQARSTGSSWVQVPLKTNSRALRGAATLLRAYPGVRCCFFTLLIYYKNRTASHSTLTRITSQKTFGLLWGGVLHRSLTPTTPLQNYSVIIPL